MRVRRTGIGFELTFQLDHPAAHHVAMALLAAVPTASLTPAGVVRLPYGEKNALTAALWLAELLGRSG